MPCRPCCLVSHDFQTFKFPVSTAPATHGLEQWMATATTGATSPTWHPPKTISGSTGSIGSLTLVTTFGHSALLLFERKMKVTPYKESTIPKPCSVSKSETVRWVSLRWYGNGATTKDWLVAHKFVGFRLVGVTSYIEVSKSAGLTWNLTLPNKTLAICLARVHTPSTEAASLPSISPLPPSPPAQTIPIPTDDTMDM